MMIDIDKYIKQIVLPLSSSRKGENGRVLVIGGSRLFHAAPFWSASMVSKMVDMVHFTSHAIENNELMRIRAKEKFWEGMVVPWEDIDHYIEEDDCILIGPGMERGQETKMIVNELLKKYPYKRWVIDGGALQEMDPNLLNENMIVTPNKREQDILYHNLSIGALHKRGVTVLAKGEVDVIMYDGIREEVSGGSAGMTKGGTGDVLAGIVAGFYTKSPALASCVVASYINKRAGESLGKQVGLYFSANDLIVQVQRELGKAINKI